MEKKKYFIGVKLSDTPRITADRIAVSLRETFGVRNYFLTRIPHLTVKASFLATEQEAEQLDAYLSKFVFQRKSFTLTLAGFSHFSSGTLYMKVLEDGAAFTNLQAELCFGLEQFKWMHFEKTEPNGIGHVTVGEGIEIRNRFLPIFRFLEDKFADEVHLEVDKIDLFNKKIVGGKWFVKKSYKFM